MKVNTDSYMSLWRSYKPTIARVHGPAVAGGSDIALCCDIVMMQKLVINQAYDNMGLANTQMFATLFDGITRHSPEGGWFKQRAEEPGFKQAVKERDSGDPIAEGVSKTMGPYGIHKYD